MSLADDKSDPDMTPKCFIKESSYEMRSPEAHAELAGNPVSHFDDPDFSDLEESDLEDMDCDTTQHM